MNFEFSSLTKATLVQWSDQTVTQTLQTCLAQERQCTVQVLLLMAEALRRRLYLEAGYPSMFVFCVRELHLSEAQTFMRIRVAKALEDFPILIEQLAEGRLHLSGLHRLVPHLTPDNHLALLAKAQHKTKREIDEWIATCFPKEDVPTDIRKLPVKLDVVSAEVTQPSDADSLFSKRVVDRDPDEAPAAAAERTIHVSSLLAGSPSTASGGESPRHVSPPPSHRPKVEPLSEERYALKTTISKRVKDKLDRAQDLLRHKRLEQDLEVIIERGADAVIAEQLKAQFAVGATPRRKASASSSSSTTTQPKPNTSAPRHRAIPADVRRAVYLRDQGQCCFVSAEGQRCSARAGLELHHQVPFARGGAHHADNVRLMCRQHNAFLARQDYGEEFIAARISEKKLATVAGITAGPLEPLDIGLLGAIAPVGGCHGHSCST